MLPSAYWSAGQKREESGVRASSIRCSVPADQYVEGQNPPSYDKQYVRDYLETLDWGKVAPGPKLPADVIARTSAKYIEAYEKLTGKTL